MKIYLDSDFRCHLIREDGMLEVNTNFFDGKCKMLIEGYRFVPLGESWTRADGTVFIGEMITPAENYAVLAKAQQQYEADMAEAADMQTALDILGVTE